MGPGALLLPPPFHEKVPFSLLTSIGFCSVYFIIFWALRFLLLALFFVLYRSLFYLYCLGAKFFSTIFQDPSVDHFQSIPFPLSVPGVDPSPRFCTLMFPPLYSSSQGVPRPDFVHSPEAARPSVSSSLSSCELFESSFRATAKGRLCLSQTDVQGTQASVQNTSLLLHSSSEVDQNSLAGKKQ